MGIADEEGNNHQQVKSVGQTLSAEANNRTQEVREDDFPFEL
jgi:hypothetical protein